MKRQAEIRERMQLLLDEYAALETELSELDHDGFKVCIFGSARIQPTDKTFQMVKRIARMLACLRIDIVTGGGPGLMDAASLGAREASVKGVISIGLPIDLPEKGEQPNRHLDIKLEHKRFSSRLDEFMRLSHAVVVAPGGIGTMLELMYVWQLIQVKMLPPRPVVLLGTEIWGGLVDWMRATLVPHRFINPEDLDFVHFADTEAAVLARIVPALEIYRRQQTESGRHEQAATAGAILQGAEQHRNKPEAQEPLPKSEPVH